MKTKRILPVAVYSFSLAIWCNCSHAEAGVPAIFTAVALDDENLLEFYLKEGGDINAPNNLGMTALMVAADRCNTGFVNLLLRKGADICLSDNQGATVMNYICEDDTRDLLVVHKASHSIRCPDAASETRN